MKINGSNLNTSAVVGAPKPAPTKQVRDDFARELEQRAQRFLGRPGSEQRARMEQLVAPLMKDGRLCLDNLPASAKSELAKLQEAAEGIEQLFVKDLMGRMRRTSLAEDGSPMKDMAQDWMDDAMAKSISQSQNSMGIGKTVFMNTGERLVQEALGRLSVAARS